MAHIENDRIYIPFYELPDIIREGSATRSYPVRKRDKGTWYEVFCNYFNGVERKITQLTGKNTMDVSFIRPCKDGVYSDVAFDTVSYWQQGNWVNVLNWALNNNTQDYDTYCASEKALKGENSSTLYKGVCLIPNSSGV